MASEESLRLLIQNKLASGVLPGHDCTKVFGGVSNGETCDGCGEVIAKNHLVMDCIGEHYPKTIQFHVRCFYIWDWLLQSYLASHSIRAASRHRRRHRVSNSPRQVPAA